MHELSYAKEPFDSKLFILCFIKKLWIVLLAMFLGVILVGGGNYLTKVVFGGPAKYEIASTYYVDYYTDPQTGAMNNYVNQATWVNLADTDWFLDRTWEHAKELGMVPEEYGVDREDLAAFISADLLTDAHMPCSMVVTENAELTEVLNKALQMTFADFAKQQPEMLGIRVMDETALQKKDRDDRTLRACILGAVLGGFTACVVISLRLIWDTSVKVPETFTYRYGVPMFGALGKGEKELSQEVLVNLKYRFRDTEKVAVYALQSQMPECNWPENFHEVKENDLNTCYGKLRAAEGVLLLIEACGCNGKEIEHCLHELKVQDIAVQGALLTEADSKLLRRYYGGGR